jgi:predicted porin
MHTQFKPPSRVACMMVMIAVTFAPLAIADVQIYGRAHISVDSLSDGDDNGLNVSSNSSRLGFRASLDVAEGFTGFMQLEQEVRYENGSGNLTSRDSFLGLRGSYGQVRLGFFDTPLKIISQKVDFFRDQIGETRNVTRLRDVYSGGDFDFDTRFRNGIHYRSPSINDVTFDLHYATNTDAGASIDGNNDAISTAVTWETSENYLAVAYERKNDTESEAWRAGAGKTIGDWRINGLVQLATIKGSTLGTAQNVNTFGGGASYKLSPQITLKGQYFVVDADGIDRNAQMLTIGMDYLWHSSFRLLLAYARTDNESAVNYAMSKGGHGAQVTSLAGKTPLGASAGFRFDF